MISKVYSLITYVDIKNQLPVLKSKKQKKLNGTFNLFYVSKETSLARCRRNKGFAITLYRFETPISLSFSPPPFIK